MTLNRFHFAFLVGALTSVALDARAEVVVFDAAQKLSINACFTPGEDCTKNILKVLADAKHTIYVQAYSFTNEVIEQALVDAKKRGVDVRVILDKGQKKCATFLSNENIPVWVDKKVAIAHNKVIIVDEEIVVTGSFNFTRSAQERNAENSIIIYSSNLAQAYLENWSRRKSQSSIFIKKGL